MFCGSVLLTFSFRNWSIAILRFFVTSLSLLVFAWVHCQSSLLIWCQGLPQVPWSLYRMYRWKVIDCKKVIATSVQSLLLGPIQLHYMLLLNCSADAAFTTGVENSFTVKINSTRILKGILDLLNQFFSSAGMWSFIDVSVSLCKAFLPMPQHVLWNTNGAPHPSLCSWAGLCADRVEGAGLPCPWVPAHHPYLLLVQTVQTGKHVDFRIIAISI